jgi:hypothetical protein
LEKADIRKPSERTKAIREDVKEEMTRAEDNSYRTLSFETPTVGDQSQNNRKFDEDLPRKQLDYSSRKSAQESTKDLTGTWTNLLSDKGGEMDNVQHMSKV